MHRRTTNPIINTRRSFQILIASTPVDKKMAKVELDKCCVGCNGTILKSSLLFLYSFLLFEYALIEYSTKPIVMSISSI